MGKNLIDFGKIPVRLSFEGDVVELDLRKELGNKIHQTTGDIGFDDFARTIYFSEGEIDVPNEFIEPLKEVVKANYIAVVQRYFNDKLINK